MIRVLLVDYHKLIATTSLRDSLSPAPSTRSWAISFR